MPIKGEVGGMRGAGDTEPSFLGFVSNVSVVVGRLYYQNEALILRLFSAFYLGIRFGIIFGIKYSMKFPQIAKQGSCSLLQCDQPQGLQGDSFTCGLLPHGAISKHCCLENTL